MKFINDYRDKKLILKISELIQRNADRDYRFMEVCGGHTATIHRFGITSLLPENIKLISGPGCPVCVTGTGFIDKAVECSGIQDVIIATFGDLIRVPGSLSSLEKEKASGADIRIVLSANDALDIALRNHERVVVFPAIGFETTAPGTAVTIRKAFSLEISNFCVLPAHKLMPPAMESIIKGGTRLDGFICPGHVAAITGSGIFDFIPEEYSLPCVVSGFEPADLLLSILMLVRQVNSGKPSTQIQYTRAVSREGNVIAQEIMQEVFEPCDAEWRGLGIIHSGGLGIKKKYEQYDAETRFPLKISHDKDVSGCICGDILRGLKEPVDCPLFAMSCMPEDPVGACMVSQEGTCNTWYKYRKKYE